MNENHDQLEAELKSTGASAKEARELAGIAGRLKSLKSPAVTSIGQSRSLKILTYSFGALACLVVGMMLVMFSQTSLPGSPLYSLEKASDNLAIDADPSYRGIVMMKRAQQVKQLVDNHASSSLVLSTLDDYKNEALAYKSTSDYDYAAFRYCENNLDQAASKASTSERHAINETLKLV